MIDSLKNEQRSEQTIDETQMKYSRVMLKRQKIGRERRTRWTTRTMRIIETWMISTDYLWIIFLIFVSKLSLALLFF